MDKYDYRLIASAAAYIEYTRYIIVLERARNEIVAITGWSYKKADRLLHRLNTVASRRSSNIVAVYEEWRRRYCEGWSYRHERRRALFNYD